MIPTNRPLLLESFLPYALSLGSARKLMNKLPNIPKPGGLEEEGVAAGRFSKNQKQPGLQKETGLFHINFLAIFTQVLP